jgi:glycosyl transferase family 87
MDEPKYWPPHDRGFPTYPFLAFLGLSSLWLIWALRFPATGWDFTQFYIVAHLPIGSLYSRPDFIHFGQSCLAPLGIHYYPPFARPAVFAVALKPLSLLSYWHAYWVWAAIGFVAYAAVLLMLFRWLALPNALLPAFAAFTPSLFGIVTGQDATVYLLVLLGGLLLVLRNRELAGGCLLALCAYKFNLIVFLPLVLLSKARWKSLATFGIGTASAALISAAMVSPFKYFALLRSIPAYAINFRPGGIRGVVMGIGHEGWYYPLAIAGAVLCAYLIWRLPLTEAFCVAVTGILLLGYHVTWYDCALLVLPIAVAWRDGGTVTRALLLLVLLSLVAWLWWEAMFQVVVETLLLLRFAAVAWKGRPNHSSSLIEQPS